MNEPYTKLAQKIVYSSMWEEDGDTCKIWVTLLALRDLTTGIVDKNITGIARLSKIPIDKVEEAIAKFMAPDPRSTSQDHEGRRIERVPQGWRLLNHDLYLEYGWSDEKKQYERERKAAYRAGLPSANHKPEPNNAPAPTPRFKKPTREELDAVAKQIGLSSDEVDRFVNWYESNGWRVGRNPMKSWEHSLKLWQSNGFSGKVPHGTTPKNVDHKQMQENLTAPRL